MRSWKRITQRQLAGVVADVHTAFPGWYILKRCILCRDAELLSQCIGFESLSYGPYRALHQIQLRVFPEFRLRHLSQVLTSKYRELRLHEHDEKWPKMVQAMEQEFVPNIRGPLDAPEVRELSRATTKASSLNDLAFAAVLNGWLEDEAAYLEWMGVLKRNFLSGQDAVYENQEKLIEPLRALGAALSEGRGRAFLSQHLPD